MNAGMLDLVLVNPGSRTRIYQGLGAALTAVENPIWAGLIATFVRRKGFSVQIVDAEAEDLTPEQTGERALALNPRLVTVVVYGHQPSASTQNMTGASAATVALKNLSPSTKVLMLGGHVAALPERTLAEEPCDFVTRASTPSWSFSRRCGAQKILTSAGFADWSTERTASSSRIPRRRSSLTSSTRCRASRGTFCR